MKKIIQNWIKKRKKLYFKSGYNFAAGELLRENETPISLESYYYGLKLDQFDLGIIAAIKDAIDKGLVKDNRI